MDREEQSGRIDGSGFSHRSEFLQGGGQCDRFLDEKNEVRQIDVQRCGEKRTEAWWLVGLPSEE